MIFFDFYYSTEEENERIVLNNYNTHKGRRIEIQRNITNRSLCSADKTEMLIVKNKIEK